ncbi:MAG: hypothetical protein RIR01_9 [Bacteroidota bacterium]|jgi:hypothetical protein
MPKPHKGEHRVDYLQRCMSDESMINKHPDQKERYAVCVSIYKTEMAEAITPKDKRTKEYKGQGK